MPHRLKNRVRRKFHNAVTSSGVHENKILPFSIFPPSLSPFPHDLNQRSPLLLRSSTAPATTTLPSPPPASSLNGVAARGRSAPQSSLPPCSDHQRGTIPSSTPPASPLATLNPRNGGGRGAPDSAGNELPADRADDCLS